MKWLLLALLVIPGAAAITPTPETITAGQSMSFATTLPEPVSWDFGDGTRATGQAVQHDFTYAGIYIVTSTSGTTTEQVEAIVTIPTDLKAPTTGTTGQRQTGRSEASLMDKAADHGLLLGILGAVILLGLVAAVVVRRRANQPDDEAPEQDEETAAPTEEFANTQTPAIEGVDLAVERLRAQLAPKKAAAPAATGDMLDLVGNRPDARAPAPAAPPPELSADLPEALSMTPPMRTLEPRDLPAEPEPVDEEEWSFGSPA